MILYAIMRLPTGQAIGDVVEAGSNPPTHKRGQPLTLIEYCESYEDALGAIALYNNYNPSDTP